MSTQMKNNEITIEIKGLTNSGKSTLAFLIKSLLNSEGFNINLTDKDYANENSFNQNMIRNITDKIDILKTKNINIIQKTLTRKSLK